MRLMQTCLLVFWCDAIFSQEAIPVGRGTRGVWNEEFRQTRPKAESNDALVTRVREKSEVDAAVPSAAITGSSTTPLGPRRPTVPQQTQSAPTVASNNSSWATRQSLLLGLTLWGLEKSSPTNGGDTRGFVQSKNGAKWVAKRIDMKQVVQVGQRVRFSVEASRTGYVYLFDQDIFGDGTRGSLILRFPTRRIRQGNNLVSAGLPIELPAQSDSDPSFEVVRTRDDQTGIVIHVLWSPGPIRALDGAADATTVDIKELERWHRANATSQYLDDPGQIGNWYTPAEQAAGVMGLKLSAADPLPQILFRLERNSAHAALASYVIGLK